MKRIVSVFFAMMLCISLFAGNYDRAAIRASIQTQMKTYPESTLKDIYKNFFQDAFGPGHLVGSGQDAASSMRNYLMSECKDAEVEDNLCAEYEKTGWHGRFYRVNLSVINEGKVPFEVFLAAFMDSATNFTLPKIGKWRKEWKVILREVRKLRIDIPSFSEDSAAIDALLRSGEYASHHSERYEKAYHPHYRLIERSVFESRILPLILVGEGH